MKKQFFAFVFALASVQIAFAQTAVSPPESTPRAAVVAAATSESAGSTEIIAVQASSENMAADKTASQIDSPRADAFSKLQTSSLEKPAKVSEKRFVGFEPPASLARKKSKQDAPGEFWKYEFFAGYSFARVDTGFDRDDFPNDDFDPSFDGLAQNGFSAPNGFNVSAVRNIIGFLGIKVDVSAHQRTGDILGVALPAEFAGEQKYRLVNVLAGIQVKDNRKEGARIKPFGQFMAGGGYQSFRFNRNLEQAFEDSGFRLSRTQAALSLGGGVDVRLSRRVDLRLFQFDYLPLLEEEPDQPEPVFETDRIPGRVQNNLRFSIGIVFH